MKKLLANYNLTGNIKPFGAFCNAGADGPNPVKMQTAENKRKEGVKMKWYKVELEDDNFELLLAENDNDALTQAFNIEEENNDTVFGLYEINDEYENIRTIL